MALEKTLDIVINHSNGSSIALHKTLLSIIEATKHTSSNIDVSIFIAGDKILDSYLKINQSTLKSLNISIVVSTDNIVRSYQKQKSSAQYVVFMQSGDCVGAHTIAKLLSHLRDSPQTTAVYPQATSEYYKNNHPNIVYENVDLPTTDPAKTLSLSVEEKLLRFVIFPVEFVAAYEAPHALPVFIASIQHLAEMFAYAENAIVRAPHTVLFSLHSNYKKREVKNYTSPASELFSFKRLRTFSVEASEYHAPVSLKHRIKDLLKNNPTLTLAGQKTLHSIHTIQQYIAPRGTTGDGLNPEHDDWLLDEAKIAHQTNTKIYLSTLRKYGVKKIVDTNKLSSVVGGALVESAQSLRSDTYDYIIFVPWLIAGGADMFFINYANMIANSRDKKKVLIISTEPSKSSLSKEELGISESIDFLKLAEVIGESKEYETIFDHTITKIVKNSKAKVIHAALSKLGYEYVQKHAADLKASNTKIVLTGYNEIVTQFGRREGYVHESIPAIYHLADAVTTDNKEIAELWQFEYGVDSSKVLIHHQPFKLPEQLNRQAAQKGRPIRVLWAAHVRKEKNPDTFVNIAKAFADSEDFEFVAYGALDKVHYRVNPFTKAALKNLSYGGGYRNFFKEVRPEEFDVFLYSSLADGTPNILIENGLSGIPIISSSVGGIKKLVQDDGTLVEDPTDTATYVEALKSFKKNPTEFYEKANKLKTRLEKTQTYKAFSGEIEEMLTILNY